MLEEKIARRNELAALRQISD
eukprot:SAG22_NODE_22698_length_191_cov_23.141304_2_plen_20_part_01